MGADVDAVAMFGELRSAISDALLTAQLIAGLE